MMCHVYFYDIASVQWSFNQLEQFSFENSFYVSIENTATPPPSSTIENAKQ